MEIQEEIISRTNNSDGEISITTLSKISKIPIHQILKTIPAMKGAVIFSRGKVIAKKRANIVDRANALFQTEKRIAELNEYKKHLLT